jgi:DNA-directed RNA polymerase specialized sigma24 family protein
MPESTRDRRFCQLYHDCGRPLVTYAPRGTGSPGDATDVVAETFLIVWRRLDDVPRADAEVLWLYATARRVMANLARSTQARSRLAERTGVERQLAMAGQEEARNDDGLGALKALSAFTMVSLKTSGVPCTRADYLICGLLGPESTCDGPQDPAPQNRLGVQWRGL